METILLIALGALLLFFMTNRSRKQQKAAQDFRTSLAPGQEVMTASGLFGTVVDIDDEHDVITLETSPGGSQTRWLRAAIAKRVDTPEDEPAEMNDDALGADAQRGTDVQDQAATSIATSTPSDDVEPDVVVPDDLSSLTDPGADTTSDSGERHDDGTDRK